MTLPSYPRLIIAAPSSGCGKSTITSGLIAAFAQRCIVQPFKVGPDYIDPMYHTAAAGRPSRNLDTWMVPPPTVKNLFAHAASSADVSIIEGVMGLFDGYAIHQTAQGPHIEGSTAEVARLLDCPVVLVVDAARMSQSAGAVALGYRSFDPQINLAGIILNNTGSQQHANQACKAIEMTGIPILGFLPRTSDLKTPERHLGLFTVIERQADAAAFIERSRQWVEANLDLKNLMNIARSAPPLSIDTPSQKSHPQHSPVRLAVAQDEAFCFYYADNLDLLTEAGAEIVLFSPLHDPDLPQNIAGIYFGGGYPELYASQLAENQTMRHAIQNAHTNGMPIYAECGGLMYLTNRFTALDNTEFPMVGLLPGKSRMKDRLTMGYREVWLSEGNILLPANEHIRGHEFHYSEWIDFPPDMPRAYRVAGREAQPDHAEGFSAGNLLASYIHLHFASHPSLPQRLVQYCKKWQKERITSP